MATGLGNQDTAMHDSHYVPTHQYTRGLPSQPRVAICPSSNFFDITSVPHDVPAPVSHDFREGEFVCPGFFEKVNPDYFAHRLERMDWSYNMRRTAQDVLPFLYLGSFTCLRDLQFLKWRGFTLLLAIRNKQSALARLVSGEKAASDLGIEADSIDVLDNQELISKFPHAIRRINDHLVSPSSGSPQRKVLVFCETGNERSACVVITYLMVMLNLSMSDAAQMAQSRRFSVSLEEPSRQLLSCFESILNAKRDVEKANRFLLANQASRDGARTISRKRSFDCHFDASMSDDGMEADSIDDNCGERRLSAPFQDR